MINYLFYGYAAGDEYKQIIWSSRIFQ